MFLQGKPETLQSFWGKVSLNTPARTRTHKRTHAHPQTRAPYTHTTHTHTHMRAHRHTITQSHMHACTHTCTHTHHTPQITHTHTTHYTHTHTHQSRSRVSHLKLQIITSETAEYHISENSNLDVCHHETLKPHCSKLVMSYFETSTDSLQRHICTAGNKWQKHWLHYCCGFL